MLGGQLNLQGLHSSTGEVDRMTRLSRLIHVRFYGDHHSTRTAQHPDCRVWYTSGVTVVFFPGDCRVENNQIRGISDRGVVKN
nr:hypothetical protein CFP56_46812 [Quercus suber]